MKNEQKKANNVYLYGRHAVFAALENKNRKILKLIVTPDNVREIEERFKGMPYVVQDKKQIEKLLPANAVHQGFVLETLPLEGVALEDVLRQTEDVTRAVVLVLDQVTDPQNIGAIVRSAAAFGVKAIIVQDKNCPYEGGAMAKSAAGTLELVPIVRVTNLSRAIEILKQNGFWAVGMDGYAKQNIDQVDKNSKLVVIMGSEGAGMRRLIEEACDYTVRLPMCDKVESLNVSTAAAIVLYELYK